MNSLFKNEEIRGLTLKFVILQAIMLMSAYILFAASIRSINTEHILKNKVLASRLMEQAPDAKEEIIKAFIEESSPEEIKKSEDILKEYGYSKSLEVYKNPIINDFHRSTAAGIIFFLLAVGLASYLLALGELRNMFNKLKLFSRAAEELVEGSFDRTMPDNREGEFYILGYQFNTMAKRLRDSLHKLKEEKLYLKTIISDISHQLKTPLSALVMFNSIMESDEDMDSTERRNFLKRSSEQLIRMDWLIRNLLKLARLEGGAVEFSRELTPLNNTIEKAVAALEMLSEEKGQTLSFKCSKAITFRHDSDWTAEAVINIVKNAVEHTKEGGSIIIEASDTPLSVQIIIKDNGEGIPEEELPKIFKRFYKGENSANPSSLGIGLALSKSIVEGQGGSITVQSEVGRGSIFNITFLKTVI